MRMVLSIISHQHSSLKEEWAKTRKDHGRQPDMLGRLEKPPEKQDGLVYIIDETGAIQNSVNIWMPTGILLTGRDILITGPFSIHRMKRDLSMIEQDVYSMPWFNSLHSIARTRSGFLVTNTGLDMVLEFDLAGKFLWSWWAGDHGLDITPLGQQRYIERSADHRGLFYGTARHTTHINSAIELPNGDILATLFHQGMVIYIHRKSGEWTPLLEHLDHPHALRLQGQDTFTVADTGNGRALLVKMSSDKSTCIEKEVTLDTKWLQDCFYDKAQGLWILVDADHTHVVMFHEASRKYTRLVFDPELRLYGIEPLWK